MISASRIILVAVIVSSVVPVWTYVAQFGVSRRNSVSPAVSFLPRHCQQPLFARKNADEDDDWEPDENDLVEGLADLDLTDDEDIEIPDDEIVIPTDDDDETVVLAEDDDDIDEDEIDEGLDIWSDDDDEEDEEIDIVEEVDGEFDDEEWEEDEETAAPYLMSEQANDDEDWEDEDGDSDIPLQDDPNDPNYQAQKKVLEETIARREKLAEDDAFDEVDYIMNRMTPEEAQLIEETDIQKKVEALAKELIVVDDEDVEGIDLEAELEKVTSVMDDPYDNEGEENIMGTGVSDDLLQKLDEQLKIARENVAREPWDKVNFKAQTTDWATLPNTTLEEMDACLEEIGGSAYNVTNWLLYDLDFNVTNLILAAVKHNRQAPILFQHWYPQLLTYERYQHARDRNFDFNWNDVENSDVEELERYYMGFGYDEIPEKAPAETGIISFEDLDEEELKMAAFENWMTEVYNPEWDRKDFDDDDFQDEDNVFSKFYEAPQHPDLPTFEDAQEDLRDWEAEMDDDEDATEEYANMMGRDAKYKYIEDKEFEDEFRGHLVVACSPSDEDLEVAERITQRMEKEFGKQIYVETRVLAHAREDDFVFEVWLESYDIDLLHSKKRATGNVEGWTGPAEVDQKQMDYLVEEIRYLIGDEARYSYRFETMAGA